MEIKRIETRLMKATPAEIKVLKQMIENAKNAVAVIWHEERGDIRGIRMRCGHLEYGYGTGTRNNDTDEYSMQCAIERFEEICSGKLEDAKGGPLPLMLIAIEIPDKNITTVLSGEHPNLKIRFHLIWENDSFKISKQITDEMENIANRTSSTEFPVAWINKWEKIVKKEVVDKVYDFSEARGVRVGRNLGIVEHVYTSFEKWKINEHEHRNEDN